MKTIADSARGEDGSRRKHLALTEASSPLNQHHSWGMKCKEFEDYIRHDQLYIVSSLSPSQSFPWNLSLS